MLRMDPATLEEATGPSRARVGAAAPTRRGRPPRRRRRPSPRRASRPLASRRAPAYAAATRSLSLGGPHARRSPGACRGDTDATRRAHHHARLRRRAASVVRGGRRAAAPGDTIWTRQFTSGSRGDVFYDIARGPGDVCYCAGITRATEESSSLLLVKYKADGTKLWSRTWQSPSVKGAAAVRVAVARDGDVVVAGPIGVAPPASAKGRDAVVLRFAADGSRKWVARFDGSAHKDDYAADLGARRPRRRLRRRHVARQRHRTGLSGVQGAAARERDLVLGLRRPRSARPRHRDRRRRRRQLLRHGVQPGQERHRRRGHRRAQPARRPGVARASAVRR